MEEHLRGALRRWFVLIEDWSRLTGVSIREIRELWEEVSPTTPPDAGST